MPRRADQRPAHARPRIPDQATAEYLRPHPLTPLADRERGASGRRRFGWRIAGLALVAAALAVSIPLVGAALGQAAPPPIEPLAGGVAGAISDPSPNASLQPFAEPVVDSRLVPRRASDPDGPTAVVDRGAPPIARLTGYAGRSQRGRISLPFKAIPGGTRIKDGKLFHDGVDMASFCGDTVGAAHDGVVLAAGRQFDDADRLDRRPRAVLPDPRQAASSGTTCRTSS